MLALLFVVVPVVEIYVLIQVGQVIGAWWTVLLLVGDGFLGAWLMKREGTRALHSLRDALRAGRVPGRELADGALVLVGGTLLLTPGFVTDAVGLFFVVPFTRPLARRGLTRFVTARLLVGPAGVAAGGFSGFGGHPQRPEAHPGWAPEDARTRRRPGPGVVRGEVVEDPDGVGGPETGGPTGS
ncbi:MAG: FxsA family protein [Nocardioidaceae bacterium]